MSLTFAPTDRVMVIAPHPDDESLATGGLIQRISQGSAAGRVLMVTNGDNNPWPQRWMEKRWRIGLPEQERWGLMRQQESLVALQKLGYRGEIEFLQFPDQGITERLVRGDCELLERFCAEIRAWAPTHLIIPSSYDLHPDHNALYVLIQIALERTGCAGLPQYHFLVHCARPDLVPRRVTLHLSEAERQLKYEAILCHDTQMVLSRKRFLAYARPEEFYFEPAPAEVLAPRHRIAEAFLEAGALHLSVALRVGHPGTLWIAGESACADSLRWQFPISSGKVRLQDAATGALLHEADVRIAGRVARVDIPLAAEEPLSRLFVKHQHWKIFLDDAGWREVPLP